MILFRHELKRGRLSLIIWSAAVAALLLVSVLLFPEMVSQLGDIGEVFADMGELSSAFGMDKVDFGSFDGYFASECGDTLGLGGAIFAALIGASALAKEEKERTAEFLLTHPVSRRRIVTEKLLAVFAQISIFILAAAAVSALGMAIIGEAVYVGDFALIFLAYYLLLLEVGSVCFGISAYLRRGDAGIGIGLALAFYFMKIVANITDGAAFLKYITPFGYADGAEILKSGGLEPEYLLTGAILSVLALVLAYRRYAAKDIF